MRIHPGAGVIISWEPDCSPQVMTAVTPSLVPSENQNWDNNHPTLWLGLFNNTYLSPPDPILPLLKPNKHNKLFLSFTMSLYSTPRDKQPDLTYGIPEVWTWVLKFQFHSKPCSVSKKEKWKSMGGRCGSKRESSLFHNESWKTHITEEECVVHTYNLKWSRRITSLRPAWTT
jgi:hypothetical protein